MRKLDRTGQRFGRLVVIRESGRSPHQKVLWLCRCDCGKLITIIGNHLQSGNSRSCGCIQFQHGQANSPTYNTWVSMMRRCYVETNDHYRWYGALGVTVCDRWHDFKNFLADMGERPPKRTIDRINNDRGYEPGNCRWATTREQYENRRKQPPSIWFNPFDKI